MIMPLDFIAITRFTFDGQRISFDILEDPTRLCRDLLGCPLEFRVGRGSLISYDRLWRAYHGATRDGAINVDRCV